MERGKIRRVEVAFVRRLQGVNLCQHFFMTLSILSSALSALWQQQQQQREKW